MTPPLPKRRFPMSSHPKRRLRPAHLILAVPLLLLFRPLFPPTLPTHRQTPPLPPDICLLIGANPTLPNLWQINSRSLCLSRNLSLSPNTVATPTSSRCHVVTPHFKPLPYTFPAFVEQVHLSNLWLSGPSNRTCDSFRRDFVHCAHGKDYRDYQPKCPTIHTKSSCTSYSDEVTIVVPDYPWPLNIYHFQSTATDIFRTLNNLPQLLKLWNEPPTQRVVILFQYAKLHHWFVWQNVLLDHIVKAQSANNLHVELRFMPDQHNVACLSRAILLGKKGNIDMWPFLNSSAVPLDGRSVPADAVDFKRAMYARLNISRRLPSRANLVVDAPPFVVAYSRRQGKPDADGYYRKGSSRRFSDGDEAWFEEMLKNETEAAGATLRTYEFVHGETFEEQARTLADVGFLVGIHGANLVNSMFMPPFGVLLELLPFHGWMHPLPPCYVGGGNGGLKYLLFEAQDQVGWRESGCDEKEWYCSDGGQVRMWMVKVEREEERRRLRGMVREGIEHLRGLRGGVGVRFDEESLYYEVV